MLTVEIRDSHEVASGKAEVEICDKKGLADKITLLPAGSESKP